MAGRRRKRNTDRVESSHKGSKSLMVVKREIDSLVENFDFEANDKVGHDKFIEMLSKKLDEFRSIRGR